MRSSRLLLVSALLIVGCGSGGTDISASNNGESTMTALSSPGSDSATDTSTTQPGVNDQATATVTTRVVEGALVVDSGWDELSEKWFVWGVDADDTLNVRAEPRLGSTVLTELAPDSQQLTRYGEVVFEGETVWTPIAVPGGAGWVSLRYIRPHPDTAAPVIEGIPVVEEALVEKVVAAMDEPPALAAFVGSDGLTLSPEQFISDETVVVTADDLENRAGQRHLFGTEPGTGDPIESSLVEFLRSIRGSYALTSTDGVGHDQRLSSGSIIHNVAERFPDSRLVEFYFNGTDHYAGLDWQSVTLVFSPADELLAVVQGAWSP